VHSFTVHDDVIALAGIFQAAALVRQAARRGEVDQSAFQTSIESIFRLQPESAAAVFGGVSNLKPGLRTLRDYLGHRSREPDAEIPGYVVALMYLERKLVRSSSMLDSVRRGVRSVELLDEGSLTAPRVISGLARLYSDTVSQLKPRILVHGAPEYLNDAATADKIRALLLAGIRAAVLWRQVGGNRVRLLFGRKRAVAAAETALGYMDPDG